MMLRAEFLAGAGDDPRVILFAAPHLIADLARRTMVDTAFATIPLLRHRRGGSGEVDAAGSEVHRRDPRRAARSWDVTPPDIAPWRIVRLAPHGRREREGPA